MTLSAPHASFLGQDSAQALLTTSSASTTATKTTVSSTDSAPTPGPERTPGTARVGDRDVESIEDEGGGGGGGGGNGGGAAVAAAGRKGSSMPPWNKATSDQRLPSPSAPQHFHSQASPSSSSTYPGPPSLPPPPHAHHHQLLRTSRLNLRGFLKRSKLSTSGSSGTSAANAAAAAAAAAKNGYPVMLSHSMEVEYSPPSASPPYLMSAVASTTTGGVTPSVDKTYNALLQTRMVSGRVHHKTSIQSRIYNFLERPTGWKCFIYHFTV